MEPKNKESKNKFNFSSVHLSDLQIYMNQIIIFDEKKSVLFGMLEKDQVIVDCSILKGSLSLSFDSNEDDGNFFFVILKQFSYGALVNSRSSGISVV